MYVYDTDNWKRERGHTDTDASEWYLRLVSLLVVNNITTLWPHMFICNTNICVEEHIYYTVLCFIQGSVYMYYGLTNFYQNHRRYVKSRDDYQLLGNLGVPSSDCAPFAFSSEDGRPIAPCGAIANSLFSGVFGIFL
jgi:hypothetical protein